MLGTITYVRIAAGVLWGGTLATSFTGADVRLWACQLTAAGVLSLAAVTGAVVGKRVDQAYVAMAQALISRPCGGGQVVPLPRRARH